MDDDKLDYGALRDSLGYQLQLARVAMLQTFARAFDGTGVTPARLTALELVARNPGIRPARLARAMAIETSNLATLLRQLEQLGWIAHRPAPDRRGKVLTLTAPGRRELASLRRRLQAQDAMLADGLTGAERAQLSALIGKLVVTARTAHGGTGPGQAEPTPRRRTD